MQRSVYFVKAHGYMNTSIPHRVPNGSTVSFLVPLGSFGCGFQSHNKRGVPSARFNSKSNPNAIMLAFKNNRPLKEILTLIARETGFLPTLYESGDEIPGMVISNDDQHPIGCQLKAPWKPKLTRSGQCFNRGGKINTQALVQMMANKPGNYVVHVCRAIDTSNRSRNPLNKKWAQNEKKREIPTKANTLRSAVSRSPYNAPDGLPPLRDQPQRSSKRQHSSQ